jgi:hypothetical protein
MSPADLKVVHAPDLNARRNKIILWVVIALGLTGAGVAFTYKLAEFIFTLGSDEVQGFADVPVTVYFVVAAGWLSLLVWCFVTGKFHHMEQAKYDLIEQEAAYERRGE